VSSSNFDVLFPEVEVGVADPGVAVFRDQDARRVKAHLIEVILVRRLELGLTQEQLSQRSGVAQAEISRIERGRKTPNLDTYARLAAALNLDLIARRPQRVANRRRPQV
jgi:DNA-binding XRE family transcriptional regulator